MFTLQNLVFPDLAAETDFALYWHARGSVAYSASRRQLFVSPGAVLDLCSYFNAFSLGKWHGAGALEGLWLRLEGAGRVEVQVVLHGTRRQILYSDIADLDAGTALIDLSHYGDFNTSGVIGLRLRALGGEAVLTGGAFLTARQPRSWPRLAISITTFRREEAVRATVERLSEFVESSDFGPHIRLLVVDNGKSAEIEASDIVTPIPNANLGGAGGFARGLKEAAAEGFTHCLFMDDDASCPVESLHRTYAFLALAEDPNTAVAGAMISAAQPWAMWENGAIFDGSCQPQFIGTDLRDPEAVAHIEIASARHSFREDPRLYGGWWFFAFPIARVSHQPFPFFVRGDDISFSLANDFSIVTLNGVVSFQDDFAAKESPQTLYLDLRNHLVHHLVFPALERSALGTAKIAIRFILRSMVRFQYETATAQLLAWEDVMKGPGFFDEHADMSQRRADIAALTKNEKWRSVTPADLTRRTRWSGRSLFWQKTFMWLLNGHLVPFWNWMGDDVVVEIEQRGALFPIWGARRITYLDGSGERCYTTRQSKLAFLRIAGRIATTGWRFLRNYSRLREEYRTGYPIQTSKEAWDERFNR